ncbi:MBL fold metallo-hydrolase [Paenimyroides tangerinum]|uniref:MBL fold metallo-hydrolase n=1 Tax=Paenimyroides tangerinum TaxID=2488728 RepID=A0A3P3VVQ0_9FLAO|nr:MBL fold metallo-hydrolase [Paenimyroides tangerinum]RRJ86882.1 MBL fold metallo-hydrolase [Paenimyroides tangerinum]
MISIKILKAGQGDSILIRFLGNDSQYKNILIDGGNKKSEYNNHLKKEILSLQNSGQNIDLLIITHTDQDHVKGIQYLLNDHDIDKQIIKQIWFNNFESKSSSQNGDISFTESCEIQKLINQHNIKRCNNITANETLDLLNFYGAKITIISPYLEDLNKLINQNNLDISAVTNDYNYSIDDLVNLNTNLFKNHVEDLDTSLENRVSIAFLFEVHEKSILFLGDANPDVVVKSLEKLITIRSLKNLDVDYLKLSHHASVRSLSFKMLELIKTNNYIISSNRTKANLPNKISFAKILCHSKNDNITNFIFNYGESDMDNNKKLNFTTEEKNMYKFSICEPNYEHGYIITNE